MNCKKLLYNNEIAKIEEAQSLVDPAEEKKQIEIRRAEHRELEALIAKFEQEAKGFQDKKGKWVVYCKDIREFADSKEEARQSAQRNAFITKR